MQNELIEALKREAQALREIIKAKDELIQELRNRPATSTTYIYPQYPYHQWVQPPFQYISQPYGGVMGGAGGTGPSLVVPPGSTLTGDVTISPGGAISGSVDLSHTHIEGVIATLCATGTAFRNDATDINHPNNKNWSFTGNSRN